MFQNSRVRRARRARIEMIPLIDCMFLLLTFFIYVATTMVVQRGIPLKLADAATGERAGAEMFPTVSLDREGRLFFNKAPIDDEGLRRELQRIAGSPKLKTVVIQADKGVAHGRVVGILDLSRQCGVPEVVIAVEPSEGSSR